MNGLNGIAELVRELRNFQTGVSGVSTAVEEEVADVMRFEHFDQTLVLARVVIELFQFVTRRTECARWRVTQGADRGSRLLTRIDEILVQRAHDAMASGVQLADLALVLAAGFDDATS